jgi:hypothetical protein
VTVIVAADPAEGVIATVAVYVPALKLVTSTPKVTVEDA